MPPACFIDTYRVKAFLALYAWPELVRDRHISVGVLCFGTTDVEKVVLAYVPAFQRSCFSRSASAVEHTCEQEEFVILRHLEEVLTLMFRYAPALAFFSIREYEIGSRVDCDQLVIDGSGEDPFEVRLYHVDMRLAHPCLVIKDLLAVDGLYRSEGHAADLGQDVLLNLQSVVIYRALFAVRLVDLQRLLCPRADCHVSGVDDAALLDIIFFEIELLHQLLLSVGSHLVAFAVYHEGLLIFVCFGHRRSPFFTICCGFVLLDTSFRVDRLNEKCYNSDRRVWL